jgi:tol-pal system protein YbgF
MQRSVAILALALTLIGAAQAADLPERRGSTTAPTVSSPAAAPVQAPAPVDSQRQTLVDLHLQIEQLQNEVRSLRGQLETQTYELERLKNRNRDTAADLDRRVRELERRATAAAEPPASEPQTAAPAASPAPAETSPQEQKAYDDAFQLLRQGNYDRAIKAYRDFLAKYPRGNLADNAQYWIAEALYVTRKYRPAIEEFGKLLKDYPGSDKVPDAQLKIGLSHYELGEWAKTREALSQVGARYPGTPAAKTASDRLAKMKKEGK